MDPATGSGEYRQHAGRFLMLLLYFTVVLAGGFFQNAIAPIQHIYKAMFHDGDIELNMFALIFPIMFIPLSIFTIYFYSRYSLRAGVATGSVLVMLAGWLRYLGAVLNDSTCWVIFCGQALAAAGMPFLLAAAPALSDAWFSENTRAIATAVGGLAGIIGTVVASVLASGFFPVQAPGSAVVINATTLPALRSGLASFMLMQAVLASAPAIGILLLFRSRPPTPPSASAERAIDERDAGAESAESEAPLRVLRRSLGSALSNRQFLLLLVAFGAGYGALNAVTTIINQILQPLAYTDDEIGNIGAALGLGVLGSFAFGAVADVTKRFKSVVRACAVVAGGGFVWFVFLLYGGVGGTPAAAPLPHHPWVLFAALGTVGFFGVPLVPLILELGVETLFPAPEAVVGALLWLSANLLGMCATLVSTSLQQCGTPTGAAGSGDCSNPLSMFHAIIFLSTMLAISILATLGFTGRLHRLEYETKSTSALLSSA